MASSKPTAPLGRSEQKFWDSAFLAAEISQLFKRGSRNLNPAGAAHVAAEYADAAVIERRRARDGDAR